MKLSHLTMCLMGLYAPLLLATEVTDRSEIMPDQGIERIVVTATGAISSTLEAPASVTVITREQIEQATDQSMTSLLRTAAGISLSGRGVGGRNVIQLRGMDSKHSLILVDGRRISATDDVIGHSDLQYDWLPIDSIERIEVVRGPLSALYGSEAIGGVVNIITRGVPEQWRASLQSGGHWREDGKGGAGWLVGLNAAGPITEQLGASVSIRQQRKEATPDLIRPELSDLEGKDILSWQTTLRWQPTTNQRFDLFYQQTNEDRWQWTTFRGMPPVHRSAYELSRKHYGLSWQPEFGAWHGNLSYYQSRIDIEHSASHDVTPYVAQYLRDQIIDGRLQRPLGQQHELTLGAEWREETLIHPAFVQGEDSAEQKAILLQDQWFITDALTLTLGGRWDYHQYFSAEISPRAYLVWQLQPGIAVKTGYGHGFRAPTLKQISPQYRFTGPHSFVGNGDLKPESSDNLELGLYLEQERLLASAMLFHNKVSDLIGIQCIENCTARFGHINTYVNIEEATVSGLELELDWQFSEQGRFKTAYTFLSTEDKSSDMKLPGRPKHRLNNQLEWLFADQRLSFSLSHDYTGKQWQRSAEGETAMAAYHLLGTSVRYRWQQHDLSFAISNLGNVNLHDKDGSFGYNEPGRSFHVRWHYRFKG